MRVDSIFLSAWHNIRYLSAERYVLYLIVLETFVGALVALIVFKGGIDVGRREVTVRYALGRRRRRGERILLDIRRSIRGRIIFIGYSFHGYERYISVAYDVALRSESRTASEHYFKIEFFGSESVAFDIEYQLNVTVIGLELSRIDISKRSDFGVDGLFARDRLRNFLELDVKTLGVVFFIEVCLDPHRQFVITVLDDVEVLSGIVDLDTVSGSRRMLILRALSRRVSPVAVLMPRLYAGRGTSLSELFLTTL